MRDPSSETVMVPCRGCSRDLVVPKGKVAADARAERTYVTFCSRKCERTYIAREGQRQREESVRRSIHAGSPDSDVGS